MSNTLKKEIFLPRAIVNQIFSHAQQQTEKEVCGLVAGLNEQANRVIPIKNIAKSPQSFFEMDPQELILAMQTIRAKSETLYGIYHSHPKGPATPSATDIARCEYRDAVYFIVSLDIKGVLNLQAFKINESGYTELPLNIKW